MPFLVTEVIWHIMVFSCQSELNKTVFLKFLCSCGCVLVLCIHALCRENQILVRDLWLSPCKMRRGNTCQDMSLMEEICFLQWDILWVAECRILQILLWAFHVLMWCSSFLLPHWRKAVPDVTVKLSCWAINFVISCCQ